MDEFIIILLFVGGIALIVAASIYLVRKTKAQKQQMELQIQELVKTLPEDKRALFLMQYNNERKDPTVAVLLALFLGGIGIHKFYMKQIGLGVLYLIFAWTFIPAFIAFFEAFTLTHSVYKFNQNAANKTAAMLQGNVYSVL